MIFASMLLSLVSLVTLEGQANIKIGYNLGLPELPINDEILSSYNPPDSEVIESFGSIGFMHGIQLGVRYRWGNLAAEFGWESISRDRTALSYRSSTDSFSDRQYNYALSGLSIGLDNYIGKFGIGSTLLYQKLKIDRSIGNNNLGIINERQLGLRMQFIWQIQEGEFVSLMIKPYYQFSIGKYNLDPLARDVDVNSGSEFMENPKIFGISLIFYNGRQH